MRMYLDGKFRINPPLQAVHLAYLDRFHRVRHIKWDVGLLAKLRDPLREAAGLPLGLEGAYYVAGGMQPEYDNPAIIDYGTPPRGQPGFWCDWQSTGDGESFFWPYSEKGYAHDTWLEYLIEHFFTPWNYKLSGRIECSCHYYEYEYPNGDEEDEENMIEIPVVKKDELIIKNDNIIINNALGTFKEEEEEEEE